MDQGVIRSLKCRYRKQMLIKLIEKDGEIPKISLLEAITFLHKAWDEVTQKTIFRAFKKGDLFLLQTTKMKTTCPFPLGLKPYMYQAVFWPKI